MFLIIFIKFYPKLLLKPVWKFSCFKLNLLLSCKQLEMMQEVNEVNTYPSDFPKYVFHTHLTCFTISYHVMFCWLFADKRLFFVFNN